MTDESPDVDGEYIAAMVEACGEVSPVFGQKAEQIFNEHGIEDTSGEQAYPMDKVQKSLAAVAESFGPKSTKQIGKEQVNLAEGTDALSSVGEVIGLSNKILQDIYSPYSPETVGEFRYEQLGDDEYRISVYGEYNYPGTFVEGVVSTLIRDAVGSEPTTVDTAETEPDESHAFLVEL